MRFGSLFLFLFFLEACTAPPRLQGISSPDSRPAQEEYEKALPLPAAQRDSLWGEAILQGCFPSFLNKLVPVRSVALIDGKKQELLFYVTPDYLSIGNDSNWMRTPLSPHQAQRIADRFNCILPTRKMVDLIYEQARVKLAPVPLLAYRDSTLSFYHHHLIIEGQRKGRTGLIAGIKKDVILSATVPNHPKPHRVAIYGWHLLNGKPIQPVYAGHIDSYIDYSHGIRLVYRKVKLGSEWKDILELLQDEKYRVLLSDEDLGGFYRYAP
jgi:hypothetical protein